MAVEPHKWGDGAAMKAGSEAERGGSEAADDPSPDAAADATWWEYAES